MNVVSKIVADLTRPNIGARVNAVQGDGNTRLAEITLLCGGVTWTPPEGVEAAIAYMQPGGTKGLYNKLADGTAAISITGNVVTVILAPQMLTASGTVQASLVFNDQQLNRLTTFPFAVSVTSNPAAGAQKTEDYIRLQWLEDKLTDAINTALAQAHASGEFDGTNGSDGGYYYSSVSQPDANTITVSFAPSQDGMPAVPEKSVTLPAGQTGATPNIQIGTVETLPAGSPATASMDGTPENPLLNLGIPQGKTGNTPIKGTDYFTPDDKAELVDAVLAALPAAEGASF